MKKSIATVFMSIALTVPVISHAQFGNLGNLGGSLGGMLGGNKTSGNTVSDLSGQQDQLVRSYVAAGKDVLTANSHMADALGIKAQAANAIATSDSMSASQIEEQDKAISANAKAVSEALKSGATLKDAEAKAKYSQGLISLASGMKKYLGMRSGVQNLSSGLTNAPVLQLGKLQSGVYIVKNLPTNLSNLSSVLASAVEFGKSNGVEIPADATSLL